jgi:signal transduction histidine kinase
MSASPPAKHFAVDARAIVALGRNSIKDHVTALIELVKNSYDAGAKVVEIAVVTTKGQDNHIRIADNGCGMDEKTIERQWLRIGYSDKIVHKRAAGRRTLGEKGVGRISADRLGAQLELRSQAKGELPVGLLIDWSAFEAQGQDLHTVDIPTLAPVSFKVPVPARFSKRQRKYLPPPSGKKNTRAVHGTELRISVLRQGWTATDVEQLVHELSVLINPFQRPGDFQVRLQNDVIPVHNGVVTSSFQTKAEIRGDFTLSRGGMVKQVMYDRSKGAALTKRRTASIPWEQLVHPDTGTETAPSYANLGPAKLSLLFFPRSQEALRNSTLTLEALKGFLDRNAGIRVYRDNVRVLPYGDPSKPEGDWLGLGERKGRDPAGPSRPTWKVSPHQIVGVVTVGRDANPEIVDVSGREGLVNGLGMSALRAFITGCITRLEAHYHKMFTARAEEPETAAPPPRATVARFRNALGSLASDIKSLEKVVPKTRRGEVAEITRRIKTTTSRLSTLQKSLVDLSNQATNYRGLATLGITAATFGHETQMSLQQFIASAVAAQHLLRQSPPAIDIAMKELDKASSHGERIAAWGAYALLRVNFEKRSKPTSNLAKMVSTVYQEFEPVFRRSEIDLKLDAKLSDGEVDAYPMDAESVVVNLLTNAYFFVKKAKKPHEVRIGATAQKHEGRAGIELAVADNGPGVHPDLFDQIWAPLFTTKTNRDGKPDGTGLGLSIVDAIIRDCNGYRRVERDKELKGARFLVWFPLCKP